MTTRASAATCPTCLAPPTRHSPRNSGNHQDQLQITCVTHLTEDGADRRFIQQQVGHRCDTSTAIYTHVSSDFMNTALRKAIGPAFDPLGENDKEC